MSEIPPTVPPATPPPPGGGSYTPPPPPPPNYGAPPSGSGAGDRTLMIVLSYLWILFLVPLLMKKDDAEVQWHAKNGMGITIGEIIIWVAFMIITAILPAGIGCAVSTLNCVIFIGFLVLRIICIVKGVSGQRFNVPVLTDLGQKINI
jgi:uncharacterized membrane protein